MTAIDISLTDRIAIQVTKYGRGHIQYLQETKQMDIEFVEDADGWSEWSFLEFLDVFRDAFPVTAVAAFLPEMRIIKS